MKQSQGVTNNLAAMWPLGMGSGMLGTAVQWIDLAFQADEGFFIEF